MKSNTSITALRPNIPELTGLRGLAALFIIINHLVLVLPFIKDTKLCYYTTQCGVAGMSLFFILSGIVIFTYVTAYFCYRYFETPMRRIVRNFFMNGCNSVKGEKTE